MTFKPVKFVHSGDIHLGSAFSVFDEVRRSALKKSLRRAIAEMADYCEKNSVDILLLPGDIFDSSNPRREDINFFRSVISSLSRTKVFAALGNHDFGCGDILRSAGAYVFSEEGEKIYLPELNIYVTGRSFSAQYEPLPLTEGMSAGEDAPDILCIHGDPDGRDYNPIPRRDLAQAGFCYAALGHNHGFSEERLGGLTVCQSGCLMGRGFDETGKKGFVSGSVDQNGGVSIKLIPSSAPRFEEITVNATDYSDDSEMLKRIESELSPDGAYRIRLKGCELPKEYVQSGLEKSVFYCQVISDGEEAPRGPLYELLADELRDFPEALSYALKALAGRDEEI